VRRSFFRNQGILLPMRIGVEELGRRFGLAAHNARRNGCTRLRLGEVDWFSLLLGADIVYLERTYDPLLELAASTLSPSGSFILSDPLRPQMKGFLERARARGWTVDEDRWTVHFADASHEGRIRILTRERAAGG
jgi:hypothetical protein